MWIGMEHARLRKPMCRQGEDAGPRGPALLAPAAECTPPTPKHLLPEYAEAVEVPWYRVVVEVALHDRLEPFTGFGHGIMYALSESPLRICHRHYPGRSEGACSLVHLPHRRPSLCNSQVGPCNCFFGACSAFTHVMACTLAESPSDPSHRELRQLCCLRCRLDCYRVERTSSRAGVAPAEVQRPSRRTVSPTHR
jgi:hypothetical protein